MGKKSTDIEIYKRVSEIYQLLIEAYSYNDIARYCKEKYGVTSSRTVSKYINAASKKIIADNDKQTTYLRAEAVARYQRWIRKSEKNENYRDAALMQSRLDKINGLESITINHEMEKLEDIFKSLKDVK